MAFKLTTKVLETSLLFLVFVACVGPTHAEGAAPKRDIALDDLIGIRDIKSMSISPSGELLAFQSYQANVQENKYEVTWYVSGTAEKAEPLRVADGGDAVLPNLRSGLPSGEFFSSPIAWSPDDKWFAYVVHNNGEKQVWRSFSDKVGRQQLTNNAADVEKLQFSEDGTTLLFAVGRKRSAIHATNQREYRAGYLEQYPAIFSVESGPIWPTCSRSADMGGDKFDNRKSCKQSVWAFDTNKMEERPATAAEIKEFYGRGNQQMQKSSEYAEVDLSSRLLERWSANGSNRAWFENVDPEIFKGFLPPVSLMASLDGGAAIHCNADVCRTNYAQKLWWSDDGTEVLFWVRDGDHDTLTSVYGWEPRENRIRVILQTDDMLYDCEKVQNRLICGHESWISPRKIVSIDLESGSLKTIANLNPEFEEIAFTRVEKLVGEDAFGNQMHAHLVYPKGYREGMRYPVVVVQYRSRGFLRGGTGDEHPIHVLANNGFAVLSSDTPDGDGYTDKISDQLELQTAYLKYLIIDQGPVTAIEDLLSQLDQRGVIDPGRVGVSGLSQGATTVDLALIKKDYAAASAAYSIMAPPNFSISPETIWVQAMNTIFGGTAFSESGFDMRAKYSLGINAPNINTPLLLQVSNSEYRHSLQNYHALKAEQKPVEMYVYPDEYHIKWQPAHRYNVYRRNLQWFKFWLQGEEVDDPVEPEQYVRWRTLRDDHCANMKAQKKDVPAYCS